MTEVLEKKKKKKKKEKEKQKNRVVGVAPSSS
jgi:hypothetical protein